MSQLKQAALLMSFMVAAITSALHLISSVMICNLSPISSLPIDTTPAALSKFPRKNLQLRHLGALLDVEPPREWAQASLSSTSTNKSFSLHSPKVHIAQTLASDIQRSPVTAAWLATNGFNHSFLAQYFCRSLELTPRNVGSVDARV